MPALIVVQTAGDSTGPVEGRGSVVFAPSLRAAVDFANANPGPDGIRFDIGLSGATIVLSSRDTSNPVQAGGPTALVVTDSLEILGPVTLKATGGLRPLAVAPLGSSTGVVLHLSDLTLTGGVATGAAGGRGINGGGGGAGLGGAIYAAGANLILSRCTITGNVVRGGPGGDGVFTIDALGGGGVGGSASLPAGDGGLGHSEILQTSGGGGGGTNGPGTDGSAIGGAGGANAFGQFASAGQTGTNGGGGGGGELVTAEGGPAAGVNPAGLGGGGGGGGIGAGPSRGGAGGFGAGGGGAGGTLDRGGAGGFGGGGGGGGSSDRTAASAYGGGSGAPGTILNGEGGGGGGAGLGGAIFVLGGSLQLDNCTITGNRAVGGSGGNADSGDTRLRGEPGQGIAGAIFTVNTTQVVINSCTIADNSGGGSQVTTVTTPASARSGSFTLINSVVAGSPVTAEPDVSVRGLKGARAPHIRGFGNFLGRIGKVPRAIVVGRGDPGLGPLADNGGPTRTMLPKLGSRLIDAGRRPRKGLPATDQRGLPRLAGRRVDIGAVEVS